MSSRPVSPCQSIWGRKVIHGGEEKTLWHLGNFGPIQCTTAISSTSDYTVRIEVLYACTWWISGQEVTCNAGAPGDVGSISGLGRSPGERHGNPLQYWVAWRIPWTEEPARLQSIGLQRAGHNWRDLASTHACMYFPIHKCQKEVSQLGSALRKKW